MALNHAQFKPSAALAAVVGKGDLTWPQLMRKFWDYVDAHDLKNPADKRWIMLDKKLQKVFGNKEQVFMLQLGGEFKQHMTRVDPPASAAKATVKPKKHPSSKDIDNAAKELVRGGKGSKKKKQEEQEDEEEEDVGAEEDEEEEEEAPKAVRGAARKLARGRSKKQQQEEEDVDEEEEEEEEEEKNIGKAARDLVRGRGSRGKGAEEDEEEEEADEEEEPEISVQTLSTGNRRVKFAKGKGEQREFDPDAPPKRQERDLAGMKQSKSSRKQR